MVTLRAHGDGSIFADHRDGRQPCLLGLHGWGRDRRDLGSMLSATGHVSLAPDLPGFGASAEPPQAWGAASYAAALAEQVLASDGCAPYVVIGHSFGGRVAVCLAANHPELVTGLVLMGVPLLRLGAAKRPPARYRLVRASARVRLLSPSRLEAARRRFGSDDYRALSGVMRDVLVRVVNEDYRDELERIRCPVALVWGCEDRVVPFQVAARAVDHIDRVAGLQSVKGAGHDVHLDDPQAVVSAVAALVAASA
ncbi:MAG: alpha/beta hydrolase [Acidimicrobiaceae bacterium]|nr:alpha/beta hydrolase [Acidimicrobiaceae bacterium]